MGINAIHLVAEPPELGKDYIFRNAHKQRKEQRTQQNLLEMYEKYAHDGGYKCKKFQYEIPEFPPLPQFNEL